MYHYRLKIFIMLCIGSLVIAVGRLVTLQTFQADKARQELESLRIRNPEQRPTVRGKILDRYGNALALDRPAFFLYINYQLTKYMDPRWREGKILRVVAANQKKTRNEVEQELEAEWKEPFEQLEQAINLILQLADVSREEIEANIQQINNRIWELSRHIWWFRRNPGSLREKYLENRDSISAQDIITIDLPEMDEFYPLVELKTEQDRLRAQKELPHLKALSMQPESKREYPYGRAACQLIGWVAPWQDHEAKLFKDDEYMRYLGGEVVGKFGLEKVYEPVLRGRRGEVQYDIDGNLLDRKESQYGEDVRLTLDIDLQRKVEAVLADNTLPHGNKYCAAVVLEVANNDILAMASMPTFDLNTIRQRDNYNHFFNLNDPNKLYQNKALERNYPPGSTAKPLVLVAGLQNHKITPEEIISCGYEPPPKWWPRCINQWKFGNPHDNKWANNGRNALRGSCNVYFSRLADRLDARDLQHWFYRFGYGQEILIVPLPEDIVKDENYDRNIPQAFGNIISGVQEKAYADFSEVPEIPQSELGEKRYWGIGQRSLRATVLQVANALSTIARGGIYKQPRLIDAPWDAQGQQEHSLNISKRTLATVRDGMWAVVNEDGGTANGVFSTSPLRTERDMKIYGKTGSTQNPNVAWFECFAEDRSGRSIVIVVLVERGQSGSGEAVPLGEKILDLCNQAGYVGKKPIEP